MLESESLFPLEYLMLYFGYKPRIDTGLKLDIEYHVQVIHNNFEVVINAFLV